MKPQNKISANKVNLRKRRFSLPGVSSVLLIAGMMLQSPAQATGFGVIVVDELGAPMSDAAVCFGLPGTPNQFGAYKTASDGRVMVEDLPRVPLSITVSKDDYQGVQFVENIKSYRLMKKVTLLLDGYGPECKLQTTSETQSLRISNLVVNQAGNSFTIESQIEGQATHYRISDREDFKGAKWRPYKNSVDYNGSSQTDGSIYFQVRRYAKSQKNWLEARSHVSKVFIY